MAKIIGIWKKEIKEMDVLDKRNYLKDIFQKGHWEFLESYSGEQDLEDCLNEIYGKDNPLAPNNKELRDLLLECAKENISNSKLLIRKLNQLQGLF